MAGTSKKCFTMQGFGILVSASDQSGKAGSRTSSTCNRPSSSMGNLVYGESHATTKKTLGSLNAHDCHKNADSFCYVCSKYEVMSLQKKIDDEISTLYKKCFGHKMLHQETNWVPHIICNSCRLMLYRSRNLGVKKYCRFLAPAIWKKPLHMKYCYFCMNDVKPGITIKTKSKISYINVFSVIRPTEISPKARRGSNSVEIDDVMEVDNQPEEGRDDTDGNDEDEDDYVA